MDDTSRLAAFWHWFGRPFRLIPKIQHHRDGADGLTSVSWLGAQLTLFYGLGAQVASERIEGKPGGTNDNLQDV